MAASRAAPRGANGRSPLRDVLDRHVVGGDQPGPGTGLDRHVADRHPPFHRQRRDRRPVILDHVPGRPPGADLADDRQDDVLGLQARRRAGRSPRCPASGAAAPARASAWPGRARPRWCRSRRPAPRRRRGCWCGCRRRRSSCPAASGPARDRSRGRSPGGRSGCRRA